MSAIADKACKGFQWVGQSFAHCEGCGQPYWEHQYDAQIRKGAGPFDDDPWEYVLIDEKQKSTCKARWGEAGMSDRSGSNTVNTEKLPARTRAYALVDRLERQDSRYCLAAAAITLALLAVAEAVGR